MSKTAQVTGPGTDQTIPFGAVAMASSQARSNQASAADKSIELPKVEPIRREFPKLGRNEMVTIRKGTESKTLKFKKAEALIVNDGWELEQQK